jgi:hypothetical protein
MLSVGLFLNDLNFYDGSSEILISGIQHARRLQIAIDKVREIIDQFLSCFSNEHEVWRFLESLISLCAHSDGQSRRRQKIKKFVECIEHFIVYTKLRCESLFFNSFLTKSASEVVFAAFESRHCRTFTCGKTKNFSKCFPDWFWQTTTRKFSSYSEKNFLLFFSARFFEFEVRSERYQTNLKTFCFC